MTVSSKPPFIMSYLFLSCLESEADPPPKRSRIGTGDSSVTNSAVTKKRPHPKTHKTPFKKTTPSKDGSDSTSEPIKDDSFTQKEETHS